MLTTVIFNGMHACMITPTSTPTAATSADIDGISNIHHLKEKNRRSGY